MFITKLKFPGIYLSKGKITSLKLYNLQDFSSSLILIYKDVIFNLLI